MRNRSLHSGERQVSPGLAGIEHWHKWRYEFARDRIMPMQSVLDAGCGCGYGSLILAERANAVTAVDDSFEAIMYAKTFYRLSNIDFCCCDIFGVLGLYDAVVALEIIEHIEFAAKIFAKLAELAAHRIILSVPGKKCPLLSPFHYRHFSPEEVEVFLKANNFKVAELQEFDINGGPQIICVAERLK